MSLIHWWPLTEDLNDKIGNNPLQFYNKTSNTIITTNANGKIGSCYERTQTNTIDALRSKNKIKALTTQSISAWVYFIQMTSIDFGTANGVVTNHNHSTNSGLGIGVYSIDGNACYVSISAGTGTSRIHSSADYRGKTNIKNAWHHICITYDVDNKIRLYVDGNEDMSARNYSLYSPSDYFDIFNWSIGHVGNSRYRPMCKVNDVRIYDHALSKAEIQELKKALVLHYTFDDILIDKNMLYNETGLTQHNVINNAMLNKTDAAIGKYSLNCNNTYIKIPITGDITQGATASFWAKTPTYPAANQVIFADYASKLAFGFYGTQNAIISCGGSQIGIINNIKAMWKKSGWNHVVIMRNTSNQFSCYLNEEQLTLANTTNNWTTIEDCTIGCRNNGTYNTYFNGLVDDIRLYYTQLSPEEIKELYNCGGRISNLGDALTGSFIEGAAATKVNTNHTIETAEIYEQILPDGYQQLEWIETDGQAYINTRYNSSLPYLIDCDMEITGSILSNYWFGQQQNSSGMMYNGFYHRTLLEFNWATVLVSGTRKTMTQMLINNTQANITINGISTIRDIGTNGQGGDLYIFACRSSNNSFRPYNSKMKLYSFKIHEGNTYVRNFLPARRISDGAIGLYDIINNQFYTNAGSGSFTAGPTITTGQASMLRNGGLTAREIIEI